MEKPLMSAERPNEKPVATHSMLITFITDTEVATYMLDISDLHLKKIKEPFVNIKLPKFKDKTFPEASKINIAFTDDPTATHAGDWVNMGFTRYLFCFDNCKKKSKKGFNYDGVLVFKSFNVPERWYDDSNATELYF